MNRDELERLISDALDDPADAQLAERLRQAVAGDPVSAELLRTWRAVEARLADVGGRAPSIHMEHFAERVSAAISADAAAAPDAQLDSLLRGADAKGADRVDWDRFADRIGAALKSRTDATASGGVPSAAASGGAIESAPRRAALHGRIIRFSSWMAAAAAVVAMLAFRPGSPPGMGPGADADVGLATASVADSVAPGAAVARIVFRPDAPVAVELATDDSTAQQAVFMIVRHAPARGALTDSLGSF
ncbi:MAG: hypothetical protein IPM64_02865 [Phycisphaerales bacterium]|nr:hypothetical protein [Phycisphaerales bacterium]